MFGYLVAAADVLDDEQKQRYKACYCGLCKSLEKLYGQTARLTLNYDICFLVLLLSSLYEPEEEQGESLCPRHPLRPVSFARSEISDYAAGMNLALAYLKCLDDWKDEKKLAPLLEAKLMASAYSKVQSAWPRQCRAMEKALEELAELERSGEEDPDAAAARFGLLMEEIFIYRHDRWEDALRRMARALGRFIYLADAATDLDDDRKNGSYNPFRSRSDTDSEDYFRDILKMELGECVYYYDKLPLVQDDALMKNILCLGLWLRFNKKFSGKDS